MNMATQICSDLLIFVLYDLLLPVFLFVYIFMKTNELFLHSSIVIDSGCFLVLVMLGSKLKTSFLNAMFYNIFERQKE